MAKIDKYGRIRGLVGNLVFRVVNGEGVMQTRPKRRKSSGDTIIENQHFADGVKLGGALYVQLKDFSCNRLFSYRYGKRAAYMKRVLHGSQDHASEGEYSAMDRNDSLTRLFKKPLPTAKKEVNRIHDHIPAIKALSKDRQPV